MSFTLRIRPEAEEDIAEAYDWYEEIRDGLGDEFSNEVLESLHSIKTDPAHHATVYRNVRRELVKRFPYKIFYFVDGQKVEVIGVVHVKRHPRAWQKRL